jgi:hypothetical protein
VKWLPTTSLIILCRIPLAIEILEWIIYSQTCLFKYSIPLDLREGGSISAPSSSSFLFLFPAPTLPFSFWFFILFVGVFRPDQQFWHIRYTFIYLPPCCAVYFLTGRCCCLLVVFLLWIYKSFILFRSARMGDLCDED